MQHSFKGHRELGATLVKIIAEAGVNHNGSIEIARRLIVESKRAGADAIKFQYFTASELSTTEAGLARYQKEARGMRSFSSQLQMLSHLELNLMQLIELQATAEKHDIGFFVSVFSARSVSEITDGLKVDTIKIPSGEINNEELIANAAGSGLKIILSTGMSTMAEVERAVSWAETAGSSRAELEVLQCTTNYPTEPREVNLLSMVSMREKLGVRVGFSDHTRSNVAALGAVALGAVTVEKHITIDREMEGPDHGASLSPIEFASFVSDIRQMTASLGKATKEPTPSELGTLKLVRKSPVALSPISRGEEFSPANIALRRPESGLDGSNLKALMGRKSSKSYSKGQPIHGDELE